MTPKEVNDKLFPYRKFNLTGDVNGSLQDHFCTNLHLWNHEGTDPVTLLIDSKGGELQPTWWITDAIQFSVAPVNAVVTGEASSAAFIILQACKRRSAYPRAQLMFHYGKVAINLDLQLEPAQWLNDALRRIEEFFAGLAVMSGEKLETIQSWAHQARKMGTEEALKLKFLDEILTPPAR